MLVTYNPNAMAILDASRWLNQTFLCLHYYTPAFPETPNAMASLEATHWHNGAFRCRHCYTLAFPNQAARPLYVHITTGSGDLHHGTSQHAQFATHFPSGPSCPSNTIDLPD